MSLFYCVCPGSEATIVVAVKQLDRYPVDLYYLVDVSASMQENLDHVSVYVNVSLSKYFIHFFVRKGCISSYALMDDWKRTQHTDSTLVLYYCDRREGL